MPERCLVTGPRPLKGSAVFELQDDENGRLDLQDRQQGEDNSNGRVEVSSAIHIAEGCGGRLTVQEFLTRGMLDARPSGTNCASARMSSTCKAGLSSRRLRAFYGDALTFSRPVALSMTTMPPSAKGLPVGDLATAVPTWRLQHLVKGLRPSYVTTQAVRPYPSLLQERLSHLGGQLFRSA